MSVEAALEKMMGACVAGDMPALWAARKAGGPSLFKGLSDEDKACVAGMLGASIRNANYEAVQEVLAAGASLDWLDGEGMTPLMSMVEIGDCERASFLLRAGANANASSRRGGSALEQAVRAGSLDMAALLLAAGADMEACDGVGNTIMMRTIGHGAAMTQEMARMFIQAGARVEAKNIQDMTALMFAADYKRAPLVALLLAAGADADASDCNGKSVLDYAALDRDSKGDASEGNARANSKECELMISAYQASRRLGADLRRKKDARSSAAGVGKAKI